MFKLDISESIVFPVKLTYTGGTGAHKTNQIKMEFIRLERDAIDDFITNNGDGEQPAEERKTSSENLEADTDYIMKIATGWGLGKIGDDIEFSRENVRSLLNKVPSAATAIVKAFWAAQNGEAAKGN